MFVRIAGGDLIQTDKVHQIESFGPVVGIQKVGMFDIALQNINVVC